MPAVTQLGWIPHVSHEDEVCSIEHLLLCGSLHLIYLIPATLYFNVFLIST